METETYIIKQRTLPQSQDFQFLLKAGLQYVEKLGSKFWTDYNAHDPGITMLEVLCYAITELGYRADFDIKDLLAGKNGEIQNKTFFKASEIFTNSPVTINDYRKLLIDLEHISNAWLIPVKASKDASGYYLPNDAETSIYINKLEDKLSLKNTDAQNKALPKLSIRGLNKIKIELDEDPALGDLNALLLEHAFWGSNHWVKFKIVPQFTSWNAPEAEFFRKMNQPSKITIESVKEISGIIYAVVRRYTKPAEQLHFRIFPEDESEKQLIINHFSNENKMCEVIRLFESKKNEIQKTLTKAIATLHKNRNLGEDFLCVEIIEKVNIGICADIELEPDCDVVETVAKMQIAIDKIINPRINFYTLNQLVNEGRHSEDIFLGPKLSHGFIKDEELENAQLPKEIHASDIIAALMEIKGVHSVKNFMMTAYNILGKPISGATNESWILKLSGEVKPIFDFESSKLLLFQKNIPFLLTETQQMLVEQKVDVYKAQIQQKKLSNISNDFESETGEYFELDTYYSIQDEFPANYGLGKNYLSDKESPLRKAQVKQLKAYLYFYEQILADFFSQLYNAKNLLDAETIKKSYFPVYLEKNILTGEDFYAKEIYSADLKNKLLNGIDDTDITLYETKKMFYNRRNRALDHLLGRFAENFNEYVFTMYQISQGASGSFSFEDDDLLQDKQGFLKMYPEISSKRGLGIDYLNTNEDLTVFHPLWNTEMRGGYEKRVAKLLGINEIALRNIVTEDAPQTQWTVEIDATHHYLFKIVNPAVNLTEKWEWAQQHFLDQSLYKIFEVSGKFYLYLMSGSQKVARYEKKYATPEDAFTDLEILINTLNRYYENFFCLEHLLLRPFNKIYFTDEELLTVCLNDDCSSEANNDPYSFKTTIVIPGYLSRFRSLVFRKYAEKIFRQEAPAHVLLKICWVNISDMLDFQKAYKKWLIEYRHYRIRLCNHTLTAKEEKKYAKILSELIAAIKNLNTIYPEGNLYDCQISETKNPLILGNTSLGTL